jgi:hypothetical protein
VASSPAWLSGPTKFGLKSQAEAGDLNPPVAPALARPNLAGRRQGPVGKRSTSLTELGGTDLGKLYRRRLTVHDGRWRQFQVEEKRRRDRHPVAVGGAVEQHGATIELGVASSGVDSGQRYGVDGVVPTRRRKRPGGARCRGPGDPSGSATAAQRRRRGGRLVGARLAMAEAACAGSDAVAEERRLRVCVQW